MRLGSFWRKANATRSERLFACTVPGPLVGIPFYVHVQSCCELLDRSGGHGCGWFPPGPGVYSQGCGGVSARSRGAVRDATEIFAKASGVVGAARMFSPGPGL